MNSHSNISAYLIKIALFLIAGIILVFFLAAISNIVKLVIISALLAYVLDPAASFLESRGMGRTTATTAIFLFIVTFAGISYIIFLPLFSIEISELKEGFNLEETELMIKHFEGFLENNLAFLGIRDFNLLSRIQSASSRIGDWFFAHFLHAASAITGIILIPFIVFFLIKDGRQFKKSFVGILPNRYFESSLYLFHKLNIQVGNYLRGQFLDAIIVGIMATFALWFIGLNYFFIVGAFAGLANLIPYFGPITGGILAVIVSVLQTGNFTMAIYIILAFIIIKLIDDVIIQPIVVAKSVHMHPLTVLLAVLIGGKLFGILGMLLSVPIVGFVKVTVQEGIMNYRKYRNGLY